MSQDFNISVLMSIYNGNNPNDILTAVNSVLNQTYKPKQVVVMVDGPVSHEIENILDNLKIQNGIIDIFHLDSNQGLGNSLKEGTKHCKFEYIARMDGDDISLPNRFEKEIEIFKNNASVDVVGSWGLEFLNSYHEIIGIKKVPELDKDIKKFMCGRCPFCHMTTMIKKSALIKAGGYQDWYYVEDWYLWIRMSLSGAVFYNIQDSLVKVRVDTETYKRRHGIKYYKSIKSILKYMHNNGLLNYFKYKIECLIRFFGQVLITKKMEFLLYRKVLRSHR